MPTDGCSVQPLPLLISRITPLNRSPEIRTVPSFTQVTSPTSPLPRPLLRAILEQQQRRHRESQQSHGDDGGECVVLIAVVRWETLSLAPFLPRSNRRSYWRTECRRFPSTGSWPAHPRAPNLVVQLCGANQPLFSSVELLGERTVCGSKGRRTNLEAHGGGDWSCSPAGHGAAVGSAAAPT